MVSRLIERILIAELKRGLAASMQRELRSSGYMTAPTTSPARACELLSEEKVDLVVVVGEASSRVTEGLEATDVPPGLHSQGTGQRVADVYQLCRMLRSDPQGKTIPILLVTSAWEEAALARGLESGADYFLFAPFQPQELLRCVQVALLNGASGDPAVEEAGIEVFHQDRMYTLTAGRARLARALVSLYDDLRHTKSSGSWCQAELRELREQLRRERHQTERDVLLNEMVQGIAHDFGNLMETISAAAAIVGNGSPQLAPYRAALEGALAQAETLISIVQNFALFGEEHLPLERANPAAIVQEVLQAALLPLRAPHVRVETHVEGLPTMRTNATLLSRCLNNLIWNAVQAMPSGGTLDISGKVGNGRVVLEVSDTGGGISKEMQEKIFDTRYSTKSGHRGLGLSLVRSLVRRSGGDITLVHRPGRGATLALAFPVAARELHSAQPAIRSRRPVPIR